MIKNLDKLGHVSDPTESVLKAGVHKGKDEMTERGSRQEEREEEDGETKESLQKILQQWNEGPSIASKR